LGEWFAGRGVVGLACRTAWDCGFFLSPWSGLLVGFFASGRAKGDIGFVAVGAFVTGCDFGLRGLAISPLKQFERDECRNRRSKVWDQTDESLPSGAKAL